jgi:hypothetical protein
MSTSKADTPLSESARKRGVTELVHFSTNMGLTGALHAGLLLPRSLLRQEQQLERILTLNAPFRAEEEAWFDHTENWIDYVNLSVSEITTNLFRHSLRWHAGKDLYWIIMSFGIEILRHPGIYFCTTNNIYEHVSREKGVNGLDAMFAPVIKRKGTWKAIRGTRASNLTTCEQAEVLYPRGLSMKHLKQVYVSTGEDGDRVHALLGQFDCTDVQVIEQAKKFEGKPN